PAGAGRTGSMTARATSRSRRVPFSLAPLAPAWYRTLGGSSHDGTRPNPGHLPRRVRVPSGRRSSTCLVVRHLRDRPGAPARALAGRHAPLRAEHPRRSARDLRRRPAGESRALRFRPRRPRAGRGRRPRRRAARLGRQPPLGQREHHRRELEPAARRAHAPGRRRATRHRLRRAGRQPRLHHHRAPRTEQRVPLADFTTEGIGRADVWVFDVTNLGSALGGTPLTKLTLFGDTPRALAASPDGNTVYAAVFQSGNQTTALSEGLVCDGGATAGSCSVAGVTMASGLPASSVDGFRNP